MWRKYTPEEVARFETRVGEKDAKKVFPDGEGFPEIDSFEDEYYRFVDVDGTHLNLVLYIENSVSIYPSKQRCFSKHLYYILSG